MENMGWTDILEKVRVTLFFYIQVRVGSGAGGIQFIVGSIQVIVGSGAGSIQVLVGAGSILSLQELYLSYNRQWSQTY